jgi:hypothetical protein
MGVSCTNQKWAYREIQPDEGNTQRLASWRRSANSCSVHVPPYLPDAVGGLHGPLHPSVPGGAQPFLDYTAVRSPASGHSSRKPCNRGRRGVGTILDTMTKKLKEATLSETTDKGMSLRELSGRGEWIRTTDLLVPNPDFDRPRCAPVSRIQ